MTGDKYNLVFDCLLKFVVSCLVDTRKNGKKITNLKQKFENLEVSAYVSSL